MPVALFFRRGTQYSFPQFLVIFCCFLSFWCSSIQVVKWVRCEFKLKKKCLTWLLWNCNGSGLLFFHRLHPKNCLGVRQFAETMMCTTLYDAANSFVHQHFVEVSMSEEFLGLRLEEVLELVGCDELNVKAEEQVSAIVSVLPGKMDSRCVKLYLAALSMKW